MMDDRALQSLVEQISQQYFSRPFLHQARFNGRLRTTGGRYLLASHDIEINPKQLEAYGEEEMIKIIKHELCHYHLHLLGKGYRHRDQDFKQLLAQVGGSRYCQQVYPPKKQAYRYKLICLECGMEYLRKKKMNTKRYRCGKCQGRLKIENING